MELKTGQQFEVVEVLTDGSFRDKTLFKIGGWTVGYREKFSDIANCAPNGENINRFPGLLNMPVIKEVKRVGRVTVTKVKQNGK